MLKKFLMVFLLFCGGIFCAEETSNLPFYKETEHFQAHCLKENIAAMEEVLQDLEQYYKKCSQDLCYSPLSSKKIRLNMYPDIQTFHSAVAEKTLSQWKIAGFTAKDNIIYFVTPKNPGAIHTEETALKCARYALGYFIICKKYPSSSLQWTAAGLAVHMAKVYSKDMLRQNLVDSNGKIAMPSISQIDEQIANNRNFPSRSYPMAAYAYMEFLVTNWGWDKALEILENYSAFESILEVSKEEFQKICVQNWQEKLN